MPVGMGVPTECRKMKEAYERLYGEPPADLKISYEKGSDDGDLQH